MNEDLIEPGFRVPDNFPIARMSTVLVKQISQGELLTDSGIILPDIVDGQGNNRMNAVKPNVGIIYGVGPGVREDLIPGLKVFYSSFADATVLIGTDPYIMMEEREVFVILKPKNYVKAQIIPAKEVRLKGKMAAQVSMHKRLHKAELNKTDQRAETNKKNRKK